jgi:hypothetical protein
LTYDEGLFLLIMNQVAAHVIDFLLFDRGDPMKAESQEESETSRDAPTRKAYGIFHRLSIKGQAREKVLRTFVKEFSTFKATETGSANPDDNKSIGVENDQTGMEVHTRSAGDVPGSMSQLLGLVHKVNLHLKDRLQASFAGMHNARLYADEKFGMTVTFSRKVNGHYKTFRARFPDAFMTSGWALTSGGNYVDGQIAIYSAVCMNPERLFAFDKTTKRCLLLDGKHDFEFDSIPVIDTPVSPAIVEPSSEPAVVCEPRSRKIRFRNAAEGDDGFGQMSRIMQNAQSDIVANFADIGFSAKLKLVVTGRGEFIGAHFALVDGLTVPTLGFVPAIARYTSKLGAITKCGSRLVDRCARAYSLACMFAQKQEGLAAGYVRVADSLGEAGGFTGNEVITLSVYTPEERSFGFVLGPNPTFSAVRDYARSQVERVYPPMKEQHQMFNMSLEVSCPYEQFVKWASHLTIYDFKVDDESSYLHLPECLRWVPPIPAAPEVHIDPVQASKSQHLASVRKQRKGKFGERSGLPDPSPPGV